MVRADDGPVPSAEGWAPGVAAIGQRVVRPRQQVENQIRAAIIGGQVQAGERLPSEIELSHQFEVSRTTIREALRALTTEGYIKKAPGARGGTFVQDVGSGSLGLILQGSMNSLLRMGNIEYEDVAMVRQYLEIPAVRLAATNRSERDLEQLKEIVTRQRESSVTSPEVIQLDADFHIGIANASGNKVLSAFVYALHHETEPVHYLHLSPEVGRETVLQHMAILDAIVGRKPVAAERAVVKHLTYLRTHLLVGTSEDKRNLLLRGA